MKKKLRKYIILPLLAVLWLCGCGKKEETDKAETVPDTAGKRKVSQKRRKRKNRNVHSTLFLRQIQRRFMPTGRRTRNLRIS